MGGKSSKNIPFSRRNTSNRLDTDIICPGCNIPFPKNSNIQLFKSHIHQCLNIDHSSQQIQNPVQNFIINKQINNKLQQKNITDYIYQKIPQPNSSLQFKWKKVPIIDINHANLIGYSPEQVRNLKFQQKNYWFRYHLQKKRINWTNGADFMKIQKTNVLMSSLVQYPKVNMHKQVKIHFLNDKVNDAGGLLREWIHMVTKEIFDQQTGIMKIAFTDQIMYKIKWDDQLDQQFSSQLFTLFGVILGKAIFEKIPILSYLDRTILRQLTGQPIQLEDIYGFDKGLYKSWKFLLQNQINDMGLQTYFTITRQTEDKVVKQIQLIQNGKTIQVNDINKQLYVQACIDQFCHQNIKRSLNFIKNGFYKIIPLNLISVFQPFQLQMLLYGVPFIDIKDWKQNTQYKGLYKKQHSVIQWFWEIMEQFDQTQLANVLHFCTGSSRTPIQGFKKLQSNRGNVGKFLIQQAKFDVKNPYPKGHTCFNRLQLPHYPNKQLLRTYVKAIATNHLDGVFGLD